ncbi:MAG: glycosyltransferase [Lentimicrobiaceae bacterium]|jgi:cellulose synthase/poly-beta-1,6-N-acetylglucosamine synthase-like glycosyltransferase
MIIIAFSSFILVSYLFLIAAISLGWWKLKVFTRTDLLPEVKVSIIVAVRNEAGNIITLLNSLSNQDYPSALCEIIIVNDQSDDQTAGLVEEFIAKYIDGKNLKLITLGENDTPGKKSAIARGIQASTGELIVITDGDCIAGRKWISNLASFYTKYRPQMILGPVRMIHGGSFFGKLQSLEFSSLLSAAAGSSSAGFPVLANGANIAFTRKAYESCGGFYGNAQYPSGDDMFLMMSIKKKFGPKAIRFLKSDDAIVNTPATPGLKPFFQQRMRWVSKSRGYTDTMLIATSIIVFLTNGLMAATAFAIMLNPWYFKFFLIVYGIKLLIDLPLIHSYTKFQKTISLLWLFPLMELVNAFYTLIIGIAGNFGGYIWKGRRVFTQRVGR